MANYRTPGVYVVEVPSRIGAIQGVGTSTAAFVGEAPRWGERVNEPVPINNWSQFRQIFVTDDGSSNDLSNAVFGFFDNGGGRCYVLNVGRNNPITGPKQGLEVLEAIDEVAIVVAPGRTDFESYEAILSHCEKMEDRVCIIDAPAEVNDVLSLTKVGSSPDDTSSGKGSTKGEKSEGFRPRNSSYGTYYFPHIRIADPLGEGRLWAPPSGHMAGIWARTDATRGVHKAPANEPIRGALNLSYHLTRDEQAELNSNGVNAIRSFQTTGIVVWGARTLADASSEYRYLSVRRLVNMLKESIGEGTRWVVFEPNDFTLWKTITAQISAFLRRVWRDGALVGRTPEEAFFVKCNEETNPPEAVTAGEVRCLIGIAPVRPAEFVIFEITQTERGAEMSA